MLPAYARLRRPEEFKSVLRRGSRAGRRTLVVHALKIDFPPSKAGFVVSKAVGNAVVRNRVKRQLRHLVAPRLSSGMAALVVVRALPGAASAGSQLRTDLDSAWTSALRRAEDAA